MLTPTELERLNKALSEDHQLLVQIDGDLQDAGVWIWDEPYDGDES